MTRRKASLQESLNTFNVATALVLIFAAVGAVLVIISAVGHPDADLHLSFSEYLKDMAYAVGFLAIGRGLNAGLKGRVIR